VTFLQIRYRYRGPLGREQLQRLSEVTGHYGIRAVRLDEESSMAMIEFDASRLTEGEVVHWVRAAGLPLTEKVVVSPSRPGQAPSTPSS
jgi:hypothetical protein